MTNHSCGQIQLMVCFYSLQAEKVFMFLKGCLKKKNYRDHMWLTKLRIWIVWTFVGKVCELRATDSLLTRLFLKLTFTVFF